MPALPLDDAGPYVAGAYLVFLALILIYVAIMAVEAGPDRARARRARRPRRGSPRDADAEPERDAERGEAVPR